MTENQDKKCSKRHFIAVSSTYNLKSFRHHPTMVVAIKRNRRFRSSTGRLMRKRVKREIYKRGCWRGSSKWKGKIISGSNTDKIIQLLVLVENKVTALQTFLVINERLLQLWSGPCWNKWENKFLFFIIVFIRSYSWY